MTPSSSPTNEEAQPNKDIVKQLTEAFLAKGQLTPQQRAYRRRIKKFIKRAPVLAPLISAKPQVVVSLEGQDALNRLINAKQNRLAERRNTMKKRKQARKRARKTRKASRR